MRGRTRYCLAAMGGLLLAAIAPALPAAASSAHPAGRTSGAPGGIPVTNQILPNQFFQGLFNGNTQLSPYNPFLTDCLGPVFQGEMGHPAPGQSISVQPGSAVSSAVDLGFTGSAGDSVVVSLVWPSITPGSTASAVQIGAFNQYGVKEAVPTNISVPCYGTGQLVYQPVPVSNTAKSATIQVEFVSGP